MKVKYLNCFFGLYSILCDKQQEHHRVFTMMLSLSGYFENTIPFPLSITISYLNSVCCIIFNMLKRVRMKIIHAVLFMSRSKFLKIKCKKCRNEQLVFEKASIVVKCLVCGTELASPLGGKATIKSKIIQAFK